MHVLSTSLTVFKGLNILNMFMKGFWVGAGAVGMEQWSRVGEGKMVKPQLFKLPLRVPLKHMSSGICHL